MRRSTKAALVSGLVFPGLGHIYLRRYWLGAILIIIAGAALYVIASSVLDTAHSIAREIELGTVPLDANAISQLLAQRSGATGSPANSAAIIFLATWLAGIIDSWRVGRGQERLSRGEGREEPH